MQQHHLVTSQVNWMYMFYVDFLLGINLNKCCVVRINALPSLDQISLICTPSAIRIDLNMHMLSISGGEQKRNQWEHLVINLKGLFYVTTYYSLLALQRLLHYHFLLRKSSLLLILKKAVLLSQAVLNIFTYHLYFNARCNGPRLKRLLNIHHFPHATLHQPEHGVLLIEEKVVNFWPVHSLTSQMVVSLRKQSVVLGYDTENK